VIEIYIKLNIVNKHEYQEQENYKEIKILLPRDSEDLEKDFDYLGLDYKFLDIKDTHITECQFICKEDPMFATNITDEINRLIARANELGYTTPFNEMKKFYESVNNLDTTDRDKLLAILQVKEDYIENITDALKCFEELEKYYLDLDSFDECEFAGNQIRAGDLYMEDVLPYINMRALGKDLIRERNAKVTKYGVLCPMEEEMEISEEEEEFEK